MSRELLKQGACIVTFEKANGEVREMICTLKSEMINYESAGTSVGDPDGIVTVWDLEKNGWRRYKEENLLKEVEAISTDELEFLLTGSL